MAIDTVLRGEDGASAEQLHDYGRTERRGSFADAAGAAGEERRATISRAGGQSDARGDAEETRGDRIHLANRGPDWDDLGKASMRQSE